MGTRLGFWRRFTVLALVVLASCLLFASTALAATTRYEQTAATFTGAWSPSSLPGHSGGSVAYSSDQPNAKATFTFTGHGVDYIAAKWANRGIAAVSLDGGPEQMIDLYSAGNLSDTSTVQFQRVVYGVRNLPEGPHTLTIRVTGNRNPSSAAPGLITIDAFDVISGPPVTSSPASAPWAVALLAAVGVGGAALALRKRTSA